MMNAPQRFRKHGYDYKLIERSGNVALYKLTDKSGFTAYEVHIVKRQAIPPQWQGDGKYKGYDTMEQLAGNEDFGQRGWTFRKLESAKAKMQKLTKMQNLVPPKTLIFDFIAEIGVGYRNRGKIA